VSEIRDRASTYDADSPWCSRTFVTLRIIALELDPEEITRLLALEPTRTQLRGAPWSERDGRPFRFSGWFLSSEGLVESRDTRHHLDWLIDRLQGQESTMQGLAQRGYHLDCLVRWDSVRGHDGPIFMPKQMRALADMQVMLWLDVYFVELNY
jgi:hypothetical protein